MLWEVERSGLTTRCLDVIAHVRGPDVSSWHSEGRSAAVSMASVRRDHGLISDLRGSTIVSLLRLGRSSLALHHDVSVVI